MTPRARLLIALGLVAAGAAGWVALARPFERPPETVAAARRDLVEAVEVSGVVEASRRVVLKARQAGLVAALPAPENRRMAAGAGLLRLDDVAARLALAQAESGRAAAIAQAEAQAAAARRTLAEAEARQGATLRDAAEQLAKARAAEDLLGRDLGRVAALAAEGGVSRQAFDQQAAQRDQARRDARIAAAGLVRARAGAEVVAARNALAEAGTAAANARRQGDAAVAIARHALADTWLRAPFAGAVTDWAVDVGDAVVPNTVLGTYQDLDALVVRLPVDELDLPKIRAGTPVELVFDAYPERPAAGRVATVGRASVEGAGGVRVYPVEVRFAPDPRVRPGMSCDATLVVRRRPGALAVPAGALTREGGRTVVRVLDARRRVVTVPVEPGLATPEAVEIRRGLHEGDRVVLEPAP